MAVKNASLTGSNHNSKPPYSSSSWPEGVVVAEEGFEGPGRLLVEVHEP